MRAGIGHRESSVVPCAAVHPFLNGSVFYALMPMITVVGSSGESKERSWRVKCVDGSKVGDIVNSLARKKRKKDVRVAAQNIESSLLDESLFLIHRRI